MSPWRAIAPSIRALAAFALVSSIAPFAALAQSLPDWSGYWIGEGLEAQISGFPEGGDYKLLGQDAPWNDEGRARVNVARQRGADQKANG